MYATVMPPNGHVVPSWLRMTYGRPGTETTPWTVATSVPNAARGRGIARAAFGERRAVDLEVAVLRLCKVDTAAVQRPGVVMGLRAVRACPAVELRRDALGHAELRAEPPLSDELGVAALRAAGE